MTSQPLVPDPYETAMVEVRQSSVPGAEEGLFARHDSLATLLVFKLNIVNKKQLAPLDVALYPLLKSDFIYQARRRPRHSASVLQRCEEQETEGRSPDLAE